MKQTFLLLAGALLLFSCDSTVKGVSAENSADSTATAKTTFSSREIYRAIETGDVSKLGDYVTNDVIDHEGNMGKNIVGIDSLKHFLGQIHLYMENARYEILSEATSPDGTYHFTLQRMTGKTKENPWGMPAGTVMDDTGIDVMKLRDGKAAEHWSFTSMKDMMEMMASAPGSNPAAPAKDTTKNK